MNASIQAQVERLRDAPTAAAALSALTEAAACKAMRAEIDEALSDRATVRALLTAGSPKTRKNAARLLGALGHAEDAPALIDALSAEETRFVVPSLLLALGNTGGEKAREAIERYAVPEAKDATQAKHIREISLARDKAHAKLSADKPLPVYMPDRAREALLVAPDGFSALLCEELSALGYTPTQTPRGALVTTDNLQKLFRARCFSTLLLPLAQNVPLEPGAVASVAASELILPWRVELTGFAGDRRAFISALVGRLPAGNAPSHYALELLVERRNTACDVFLRPASVPDGRFAYRKKTLPASIAPATAACLARLAADTWRQTRKSGAPRAFDPFCGSATLLIELDKYVRCASLLGTDVQRTALSAARENCAAAHVQAQFIQKDCTRFVPKAPFDIVLTNMPFGNRVGTHADNEPLYRAFVRKLPALLSDGGVAALYTAEYRLLQKCLSREKGLNLLSQARTEAGGLLPWVFVLQKRG